MYVGSRSSEVIIENIFLLRECELEVYQKKLQIIGTHREQTLLDVSLCFVSLWDNNSRIILPNYRRYYIYDSDFLWAPEDLWGSLFTELQWVRMWHILLTQSHIELPVIWFFCTLLCTIKFSLNPSLQHLQLLKEAECIFLIKTTAHSSVINSSRWSTMSLQSD